jgi:DNA repair protein RadC
MSSIKLLEIKANKTDFERVKISNSKQLSEYIRQFYSSDINVFESSFILLMNRANFTIGYAKISQGGITGTVVDVRIVCKYAIDSLATNVVLCHNHPSGSLSPSVQDIELTKKVKAALKIMDIDLLDHIILTEDSYYSFTDNGTI